MSAKKLRKKTISPIGYRSLTSLTIVIMPAKASVEMTLSAMPRSGLGAAW
jgi:hypothetical protein